MHGVVVLYVFGSEYIGWPRLQVSAAERSLCETECQGLTLTPNPESGDNACFSYADNLHNNHSGCSVCSTEGGGCRYAAGRPNCCEAPECSYWNNIDMAVSARPGLCQQNSCRWDLNTCSPVLATLSQFIPDARLWSVGEQQVEYFGVNNVIINNRRRVRLDLRHCNLTARIERGGEAYHPRACPPALVNGVLELYAGDDRVSLLHVPGPSDTARWNCEHLGHTNGVLELDGYAIRCIDHGLCILDPVLVNQVLPAGGSRSVEWVCEPGPCSALTDATACAAHLCLWSGGQCVDRTEPRIIVQDRNIYEIKSGDDIQTMVLFSPVSEGSFTVTDLRVRARETWTDTLIVTRNNVNTSSAPDAVYWSGNELLRSSNNNSVGILRPLLSATTTTTSAAVTTTGCTNTIFGCGRNPEVQAAPPIADDAAEDRTGPWLSVGLSWLGCILVVFYFADRP